MIFFQDYMNLDDIHGANHNLEVRSYLKEEISGLHVEIISSKASKVMLHTIRNNF